MSGVECVIRGDGKGYACLATDKISSKGADLILTVEMRNGNSVQGETVALDDNSVVLVFPIMAEPIVLLVSTNKNPKRVLFKKKINPFLLKWESRFNYRFRNSVSRRIRDAEELNYFSNRSIKITGVVPDGDYDVIRGTVSIPDSGQQGLNLQVYDSNFECVETKPLPMGSQKKRIVGVPGIVIKEESFSLRIPALYQPCVITTNNNNGGGYSFACISKEFRDGFIKGYRECTMHAQASTHYQEWIQRNDPSHKDYLIQKENRFEYSPLVSIVTPVFNTQKDYLREMLESVLAQTYSNWEHILVNASPGNTDVLSILEEYKKRDMRFRIINIEENRGITLNAKIGIDNSKGEFVAFLDHDDILQPNALYEYILAINDKPSIDLLYSDEDKIIDSVRCDPYFKPDFSLFLLREINYICHFLMIRKSIIDQLIIDDPTFDGAQDHNMILQCIEKTRNVHHVPKILYSWRVSAGSTAGGTEAKPYANIAGKLAVERHLSRCGINACVKTTRDNCRYHVRYHVVGKPLISILIPNKDSGEILRNCITSILDNTDYENYEIIIIENNSVLSETFEIYEELKRKDPRVLIVTWSEDGFNYPAINNYGAKYASGDYLLLLNNDIEAIEPTWLETMLGICQQPEVGIVGAKLLYPDMLIQHAGVYVQGDGAGHLALNLPRYDGSYFNTALLTRELSAVTAACLMVKREAFDEVGGLDTQYAVAFNDIDFCMKVRECGWKVIYSSLTELIHYESISRGYENTSEKIFRFNREASLLRHKWSDQYVSGDPYMNVNLAQDSCYYKLG